MLPTQPYYDNAISARPFDLNEARHYLQLAGYSPPGGTSNVVNLGGILTFTNGTIAPNYSVDLDVTNDNSTYQSSLQLVTQITTDTNGNWSFSVYPTAPGTYYYYLLDNSTGTPQYTYLQSYTVTSSSPTPSSSSSTSSSPSTTSTPTPGTNYTLVYVAVAVVIIIIVMAAVLVLARRRHK